MALWVVEAMLLAGRVEVASRRLEVGRIALRLLVEVHGMNAGRQILQLQFHLHASSLGKDRRRAHIRALGVFQLDDFLLHWLALRKAKLKTDRENRTEHHSPNWQFALHNLEVVPR